MNLTTIRMFSVALVLLLAAACSTERINKQQAMRSELASKGIPFNAISFISAAKYAKPDIVKKFLEAGMDVNVNIDGTALIAATASKDLKMVKLLLNNGADVNETNYLGSALNAAIYVANYDIAKTLIEHGADVNLAADDGTTPIVIAAKTGQAEMIELLAQNDANVNYEYPKTRITPLIFAAFNGHLAAVEQLIKADANVNYKDPTGMTVLDWGLLPNNLDIAKALIKAGANIQSENKRIMLSALCHNDEKFIGYLIKHGANVNAKAFGEMPLIVWCAKNNLPEAAAILIKYGADTKVTDNTGSNALDYALMNKDYKLVKILDPSIDTGKLPKKSGDPNLKASKLQFKESELLRGSGNEDTMSNAGIGTDGIDLLQQPKASAEVVVPDDNQNTYVVDINKRIEAAKADMKKTTKQNPDTVVPDQKQLTPNTEEEAITTPPGEKNIPPEVIVPGEKPLTTIDPTTAPPSIHSETPPSSSSKENTVTVVPGEKQQTTVKPPPVQPKAQPPLEPYDPSAK